MSIGVWAEKYRPKTLDEMVDREEIVNRFKSFVKDKNLPHLLLVGPAGVGKTTSILCLARDLYGSGYQNYTRTCLFCLIGNYTENIIDPIQSRCSVFRFSPLAEKDVKNYVSSIVKK